MCIYICIQYSIVYMCVLHSSSSRSTQKSPTQYFFSLLHAVISPRGSPKNWSRPPRWKFATFKRTPASHPGIGVRLSRRSASCSCPGARARTRVSFLPLGRDTTTKAYRVAPAENRVTRRSENVDDSNRLRCTRKGPGDFQSVRAAIRLPRAETVTIRRKSVPGARERTHRERALC